MQYALGFDGGGTKTECVLMDEALLVRGRGRSGPSNPLRVGFGGALAAVCEAGRLALQGAATSLEEVRMICVGLAGTAQPESERKMKKLLSEEFAPTPVHLCTDLDLTLEATGGGRAVVLIAGTGSAAVGRDQEGRIRRVGGHGPLLDDEGSAYDVGRRVAIAALRDADRGKADAPLARKILHELGMADWEEFQLRVYAVPDEVFPRVFPVVAEAAERGDATARAFLEEAAANLAGLVSDLVERLDWNGQKFLLVKTGGMIGKSVYFDQHLDLRLRTAAPEAEFGSLVMTPAEAAARLAFRLLAAGGQEGNGRGGT